MPAQTAPRKQKHKSDIGGGGSVVHGCSILRRGCAVVHGRVTLDAPLRPVALCASAVPCVAALDASLPIYTSMGDWLWLWLWVIDRDSWYSSCSSNSTMSFNAFTSNLSQRFQELSTSVSQKTQDLSTTLPSLAQTTQRRVQERLGQVTDISQLPQEYVELEKKVDALKLSYGHLLQVTSIYESESYDYPKYVNDSLNDFSKSVASKVQELSHATSTAEAQNILVAPGPTTEPKTLNYALSKVALTSSEMFHALPAAALTPRDSQTAAVLLGFSNVQAQVAQQRLAQDTAIQTKFNKALREELASGISAATQARNDVQNKRLQYDVARANLLNARPEKEASLRVQMEQLEDEFAQATENATVVMQRVLAQSALLPDIKVLAQAQRDYFQNAAKLMDEFLQGNAFATEDEDGNEEPASESAPASRDTDTESTTKGGITMSVDDE